MITDDSLYNIAVFLGILAMLLIVLYHFLEVNSKESNVSSAAEALTAKQVAAQRSATADVQSS